MRRNGNGAASEVQAPLVQAIGLEFTPEELHVLVGYLWQAPCPQKGYGAWVSAVSKMRDALG